MKTTIGKLKKIIREAVPRGPTPDVHGDADWDDFVPEDLEQRYPGILKAVARLNAKTGAGGSDEGFAPWQVSERGGVLFLEPVQPHYLKGPERSFAWDAARRLFVGR